MFFPLDGFNQHDRHETLAVESGFYSGGLLLILPLSRSCNVIFYWVHNFLSASDARVTSWDKVGRLAFDSGKFDCALKTPTNTHHIAVIQRKTYVMVSTSRSSISTWHEWCGREVRSDDKRRIICTGKLFTTVINNPWHIITENLNPWTELYIDVRLINRVENTFFKLLCLQNPFTSKPSSLIIIKEHISKLRITLISPHVTRSCTWGRIAFMCAMCFFLCSWWTAWKCRATWGWEQKEKPVR